MFRQVWRTACCGIAAIASTSLAAQAEPVPIEDLARLPAMESVSIAADGSSMFALIGPAEGADQDRAVLASWDLNDLSKPPVLASPYGDDSEFIAVRALKNGYALTIIRQPYTGALRGCSEGKTTGSTRTWVVKYLITDQNFQDFEEPFIDSLSMRGVSKATEICMAMEARGTVRSRLPLDPEQVVISKLNPRTRNNEIAYYNLDSGHSSDIFKNTSNRSAGYIDDRDGEVMSASGWDEKGNTFQLDTYLRAKKGAPLELHPALSVDLVKRQELEVSFWDAENDRYFIVTNKFSDKKNIYTYDPVTREFSDEPVFGHPDFDASFVVTSSAPSRFGRILGFAYDADVRKTEWVDPEVGAVMLGLEQAFPGQNVNALYISDDLNRIVFSADSSSQPARYFILDDKSKLSMIGNERPWIKPEDIGQSELVFYSARDGMKLPALLTPRAGWQPGDAPGKAIVLPHGGPWARDHGGWDSSAWLPFLTSRGYTVLQPQYRGSSGWGLNLWTAGDAQFGYKAQDDKDDGAAWLVSEGYAAEDKIAMFGYSYGGYAAMAAATRPNSPYQCAIAGAGYAESARINVNVDQSRFGRMAYADALSGRDVIKDVSQSEIPVLIFHGDRDVRVPDEYGKAFYNAIKDHTVAKYVNIPDMPHSLPWTPEQQRLSLATIEDFLNNECGLQ